MAIIEVKATKGEKEAVLNYDFGDNLQDAAARFGDEVVFTNYVQAAKISLQALMRARLEKGGDVDELLTIWKPGVQLQRSPVDALAVAKSKFAKMSQEERLAFLEQLQSLA